MKILGRTSAGKIVAVAVDDNGYLQIEPLFMAEDDESNLVLPLADGGRELIVRPDHDEKIFSFEDVVSQQVNFTATADEDSLIQITAVPAGYFYRVDAVAFMVVSATVEAHELYSIPATSIITIRHSLTTTQNIWYTDQTRLWMKAGGNIRLQLYNIKIGNNVYLRFAGIKMKAP